MGSMIIYSLAENEWLHYFWGIDNIYTYILLLELEGIIGMCISQTAGMGNSAPDPSELLFDTNN